MTIIFVSAYVFVFYLVEGLMFTNKAMTGIVDELRGLKQY